jgi:hypothetical protein
MPRYARIENDRVVELFDPPPGVAMSAIFHPSLHWIPIVDPNTDVGWIYNGGVMSAPPPPEPEPVVRRFTFLEFMAFFTGEELAAIVNSAETQVKLFMLMAAGASYIDLDDARTAEGLAALVAAGLLTAERADAVLAAPAA